MTARADGPKPADRHDLDRKDPAMLPDPHEPSTDGDALPAATGSRPDQPTLAEDLLLLLFQPASGGRSGTGTIAGEGTLFYGLAGALLAELALNGRVRTDDRGTIEAIEGRAPTDELLRAAWDYIAQKPRGVQTVLAPVGPTLRPRVLARLVERGDIAERRRRTLGLESTALADGGSGRRATLLAEVRAVLVDEAEPTPRAAALAALLSGSGTLPQFHREIPWTSPVIERAKQLEQGDWAASATAQAVARTTAAVVTNSVIVATTVLPRA